MASRKNGSGWGAIVGSGMAAKYFTNKSLEDSPSVKADKSRKSASSSSSSSTSKYKEPSAEQKRATSISNARAFVNTGLDMNRSSPSTGSKLAKDYSSYKAKVKAGR